MGRLVEGPVQCSVGVSSGICCGILSEFCSGVP